MSLRGKFRRSNPVAQPSQPPAAPPELSMESKLLSEFRSKTAPPAHDNVMAQLGSSVTRNQQMNLQNPRQAPERAVRITQEPTRELAQQKQDLMRLNTTVQNWHQVLTEMTQAVFLVCATCVVDNVPFFVDLPESKGALRSSAGTLSAGDQVTLMYPQLSRPDMIYMRVRRCDPRCGDIQIFYVPVANQTLTERELADYAGISSSADQYFDWFHNPGEPSPQPK